MQGGDHKYMVSCQHTPAAAPVPAQEDHLPSYLASTREEFQQEAKKSVSINLESRITRVGVNAKMPSRILRPTKEPPSRLAAA